MNLASPLRQLADLAGIVAEYHDIWGTPHTASDTTRRGLLQSMGIACSDDAEISAALLDWQMRHWQQRLAPVQVVPVNQAACLRLHLRQDEMGQRRTWTLRLENGATQTGMFDPASLKQLDTQEINGEPWLAVELALPDITETGYHQLQIDGFDSHLDLIVHPPRCHQPLADGQRVWGLSLQLYGVRSRRNWGIGDFTDLRHLVEWSAKAGAGLVGVNPLHALFPHNPHHNSPYSPSSREFLNTLYIDVEAVPEFAECTTAHEAVAEPAFQAQLRRLRDAQLVDYAGVAAVKSTLLEHLYRHFRNQHLDRVTARAADFHAFQAQGGPSLAHFALYQALQEHFFAQDTHCWGWPVWPEEYRDPTSASVTTFATEHQTRIEFFQYLQWLAATQLSAVGKLAHEQGMSVGLYQDLAVGVDLGGADTWSDRELYALGARIGCPPDDFSLLGQDWGLPPWIPERLHEQAYAPFIAMLRANMRGAGALRLDHVMGLMRLYWAPPGEDARAGAYLNYPLHDLLGILALESQRNRCLIVGEDLGTVPDEVRGSLHDLGVLSYRLFYFERNYHLDSAFKAPHEYLSQALVAGSTHDLPTLTGFWCGADIELRTALGLYPSEEQRNRQIEERAQDRGRLLAALAREDLLPEGVSQDAAAITTMTPALLRAIHCFLARTPAKLAMLQAEDLLGQMDQANLPGTVEQHPNWQRKLNLDIEAWATNSEINALVQALTAERGQGT